MHVGNFRGALYNYLFARQLGGVFYLRIEDTDRLRYVEGGTENILRTIKRMGLDYDEGPFLNEDGKIVEKGALGPYVQSVRLPLYAEYAERLVAEGKAYRCYCSSERLAELRQSQELQKLPPGYDGRCRNLEPAEVRERLERGEPHVIRFNMPKAGETVIKDLVRGEVTFQNALQEDFVILKSDGFPTYHLASIVDDHLMQTTHVIRGEEWLASIPKHVQLYKELGWDCPAFAHLPLLLNPDRSKLSKRQGDVAVEDYLEAGYLPEALINFVALLGWSPGASEQEIYSLSELVEKFDLKGVNSSGAVFNREKLDWLNGKYLRALTPAEFARRARPFLEPVAPAAAKMSDDDLGEILSLEQERVHTLKEVPEAVAFLLAESLEYPKEMLVWKKSDAVQAKERLVALKEFITGLDEAVFAREKLEEKLCALIIERGWGNGDTLWPLRVALSGRDKSPGPFEIMEVLGKMKSLGRIEAALYRLA
jgi:glutamyl-tRNA synthetase